MLTTNDHACLHAMLHVAGLLVQDGAAMSIDLLGSCYTDELRPPALAAHHIASYLEEGISASSPGAAGTAPSLDLARALGAEVSTAGSSFPGDTSQLSLATAYSSIIMRIRFYRHSS